jgi:hypothetical protein
MLTRARLMAFAATAKPDEAREFGVWTTPDGTSVAWFKDPDGNILSLTQF